MWAPAFAIFRGLRVADLAAELSIIAFALFSLLNARELASGTVLARGFCGYAALFLGIRLALRKVFKVGEYLTACRQKSGYVGMTILFGFFTVIYGWGAWHRPE